MGLFLDLGILKNCDKIKAKKILDAWAKDRTSDISPNECQLDEQNGDTVILLNADSNFEGNAQFFKYASSKTNDAVMSLYIYDGDYWGYNLFDNGQEIDKFNPLPDYFDDIDESEIEAYKGNSDIVAQYFNINKDSIENYLIFWTDELMDEGLAYENDEFGYEDWQLVDFMEKLGYKYFE